MFNHMVGRVRVGRVLEIGRRGRGWPDPETGRGRQVAGVT